MPHRLGSGSYIYLRMVVENPGITQTELVDRIIIDRATVSKMLNKLEKENLIRRRPHPEDGRAIVLEPTEDALGIYDSAGEVLADYQAMMLEGVSPEDQAATLKALRQIAENIRRANDAEKKLK